MAAPSRARWSPRSQELLRRALRDQAFLAAMLQRGMPSAHLALWDKERDVPITMRSQLRGWLEDWAYAHPAEAVGLPT